MESSSAVTGQRYAALVESAGSLVIGLDFDGTLAPIVDDPQAAHIHPDAGPVLVRLARQVRAIAVITGRPARQVLALGGLDTIGDQIGDAGGQLLVLGQYGNERWTPTDRRVVSPAPPRGLAGLVSELPRILRGLDLDPWVEDKGLAVALHTRRLDDPQGAFDRLLPAITTAARSHGLAVEPGRFVIEVRGRGMDKGQAVHTLASELEAGGFLFAGDDLGDLEAFEAVAELADQGLATYRVCSGSQEEATLRDLADVVVSGPTGVLALLAQLSADIDRA